MTESTALSGSPSTLFSSQPTGRDHGFRRSIWSKAAGLIGGASLILFGCGTDAVGPTSSAGGSGVSVSQVDVSPDSAELTVGASLAFSAAVADADGNSLDTSVDWTTTDEQVVTLSDDGVATGESEGTAKVIATADGVADTASVQVTGQSSSSSVSDVSVSPSSTTLAPSEQQTFSASGQNSDGVTVPVSITWSATGGSIDSDGAYTAGTAEGDYEVVATDTSGLADTAQVRIEESTTVSTNPADPTLLPAASGQGPIPSEWRGDDVSAGESFSDPATGVRVWRVTDPETPITNVRGVPDYAAGGPQISLPWGPDEKTYTLHVLVRHPGGPSTHFLVDFTLGEGFSNWRESPVGTDGEIMWAFSYDPETPRIGYYLGGTRIRKFDTESMTEITSGNFPSPDLGINRPVWLSIDRHDEWMTTASFTSTSEMRAYNGRTGELLSVSVPNGNELKVDPNGRYAYLIRDGTSQHGILDGHNVTQAWVWDLEADEVIRTDWPTSHEAPHGGFLYGVDPHQSGGFDYNRMDPTQAVDGSDAGMTRLRGRDEIVGNSGHTAGQWTVGNANDETGWHIHSGWGSPGGAAENNSIIFIRGDGSDVRLLAHTYSEAWPDYYAQPHATLSPDGKLVLWGSDMGVQDGDESAFLAVVPSP